MRKAMTSVVVLGVLALILSACSGAAPDGTLGTQASNGLASSATPVSGSGLCTLSDLKTVYRQDEGVWSGHIGFIYTVRNTGPATCGLSNEVTLSGHQERSIPWTPTASPPTNLQLAAPNATPMPVKVLTQTPSVLPLAPGAEATLAMLSPEGCPGLTTGYGYAELTLNLPSIGPVALRPDVAVADCGGSSVTIQPWNPGEAPYLYVPSLSPSVPPTTGTSPTATAIEWYDSTWLSASEGWVLGLSPCIGGRCMDIEHTVDGGQTWTPVTPPALPPLAAPYVDVGPTCDPESCLEAHIRFVTSQIGYLFGPDLFTTTNGGRTWTKQPGSPTFDLEPVGDGLAWRLVYSHTGCPGPCNWQLQQQQIGTQTWTSVSLPAPAGEADSAQIVTNENGQVVIPFYGNIAGGTTSQATFFLTDDHGEHWTQRVDPCGNGAQGENDADQTSMAPDGTLAVLCIPKCSGLGSAFVITSDDGGTTFGPSYPLPSVPQGSLDNMIAAASRSTIVVATGGVSDGGALAYTLALSQDGGATWTTIVEDPETVGSDFSNQGFLAFTTSSAAHWIGYPGKLWTTTDSGQRWTTTTP